MDEFEVRGENGASESAVSSAYASILVCIRAVSYSLSALFAVCLAIQSAVIDRLCSIAMAPKAKNRKRPRDEDADDDDNGGGASHRGGGGGGGAIAGDDEAALLAELNADMPEVSSAYAAGGKKGRRKPRHDDGGSGVDGGDDADGDDFDPNELMAFVEGKRQELAQRQKEETDPARLAELQAEAEAEMSRIGLAPNVVRPNKENAVRRNACVRPAPTRHTTHNPTHDARIAKAD
jgi:hypothetical protein